MLVVLPVGALGVAIVAWRARLRCWREALVAGALCWGVVLVVLSELLSGLHALTTTALAIGWLVALGAGLAVVVSQGRRTCAWTRTTWAWSTLPAGWFERAVLGLLVVQVLVLGAVAVIGPPNTWDAMTYHLARLIHWQQDASLAPYPTHILRQLYLQPGAELVLLQLHLLGGGDALDGLVQWASTLGSVVGVALLASLLGAGQRGAICASIVAASVPIGILEATSTQNDAVVAWWLVCTSVFGLRVLRGPASGWATWAALGASLGLALLTKATAYLFALPLLVWIGLTIVRRRDGRAVRGLVLAGLIAAALNAGHYARNVEVFGSPLGPTDEGGPSLRYMNDALTPALLVSNVVRDLGVNLVATPLAAINVRALNFVRLVHTLVGADIDDPRTTWGSEPMREQPVGLAFDENFAANPVHLALLGVALVAVWPLRRRLDGLAGGYALVLVSGWLLFAAILRWQPWHTRLELPLFVLGAPLIAIVLERLSVRLTQLLCVALVLAMLPWVAYNQARPLVGPRSVLLVRRTDQFFTNRPGLREPYLGAIASLMDTDCRQVGFIATADGWEYPLRALLPGTVAIEHVDVTNVSAGQSAPSFVPCAVLALGPYAEVEAMAVGQATFERRYVAGSGLEMVSVLVPAGADAGGAPR